MYIDITEQEFLDKIMPMGNNGILRWLQEEGLMLKLSLPELERGVYRRLEGMDLIEYDGNSWKSFNPATVGRPISWYVGKNGDNWVQVLDVCYLPVTNGLCVRFDRSGTRTG